MILHALKMSIYMLRQRLPLFKYAEGDLDNPSRIQKEVRRYYDDAVNEDISEFRNMKCSCGCSRFYFNGSYSKKILTDAGEIIVEVQRIRCSSPLCNKTYCLYLQGMAVHEQLSLDSLYQIARQDFTEDPVAPGIVFMITPEMIARRRAKYRLFWLYVQRINHFCDCTRILETLAVTFMNFYTPHVRFFINL